MSIFWGEFVGTLLLVLLGNGAVANVLLKKSKGENSGWIVISAGWGFAVAIAVYTTGWVSGGHLNPAVTLGFILAGMTPWSSLPLYLTGQMLGAIAGAFLVWLTYLSHWKETSDPIHRLLCFSTRPAIRDVKKNFLTETIATAIFLIGLLGIINSHNHIASGIAPYAIGILVFSIGLSLGGPTGYAINPARDLGPRIVFSFLPICSKGGADWEYAWVPVAAPLLGGALGALLYQWIIASL
jgi:glycerol uptake facilitator protein